MKKVLLIAILAVAGVSNAQDMKFGVKGGLNFANVTNTNDGSNLTAFHLGGFANFKVADKFAVQPELLYSAQGSSYTGGKFELNYINVPVMAQFEVSEGINLEVGPQIGFLMSAKSAGTDVKEYLSTTDFSLNLGAAYNIDENMSVGLRYGMGLTKVQKELGTNESASKNSVVQLSFGYSF